MTGQSQPQPPSSILVHDDDLANALESLRLATAAERSVVRTLRIRLTDTNLFYWHGSVWPGMYEVFTDETIEEEYPRLYPGPESLETSKPSEVFRAILRFVAESFDLKELDLEVNASDAAWSFFGDTIAGAYGDDIDEEWRFMYDFFMDVGRALAEAFDGSDLRELRVKTAIWDGIGQWLEGQITGREVVVTDILPRYHDVGMRLLSAEAVNEPKERRSSS